MYAVARFAFGSVAYRPKAIYALRFLRGKHCCCTCLRPLQLQWYSEPEFWPGLAFALRYSFDLHEAWDYSAGGLVCDWSLSIGGG